MSRTFVPVPGIINPEINLLELRDEIWEQMRMAQGDMDKAGDPDDHAYYEGVVEGYAAVLRSITINVPEIKFEFSAETSSNWVPNLEHNTLFLKAIQDHANIILNAKGHIFVNDVLDLLGIARVQEGVINGWVSGYDGIREYVDVVPEINEHLSVIPIVLNGFGPIHDKI